MTKPRKSHKKHVHWEDEQKVSGHSIFQHVDINIEIPLEEKQEVDSHTETGCTSCFNAIAKCLKR